MATPAFIYAFDNLGPDHFTELCGVLLGKRYKGFGCFLMGGIGPDGGIDAEIDNQCGVWSPEIDSGLLGNIVHPGEKVIFQFKHKVIARVGGQANARKQLLNLYQHGKNHQCELCGNLITKAPPATYVLVTNVEVNSNFRDKFKSQCQENHPEIQNYQVIGLDELETWITMEPHLRHLYFPTIFGPPRFDLKVKVSSTGKTCIRSYEYQGQIQVDVDKSVSYLQVEILNVGVAASYITMQSVVFKAIIDGQTENLVVTSFDNEIMNWINPDDTEGAALEPGRKRAYGFPFEVLTNQFHERGKDIFLEEILVKDEIGNVYRAEIPEDVRVKI